MSKLISIDDRQPCLLLALFAGVLLLMACSPAEQEQFEEIVAPIAETALSEGQDIVATEAAEFASTAVSEIGTEVVEFGETAVSGMGTEVVKFGETAVSDIGTEAAGQVATSAAGGATEVAQILTPDPPEIIATPGAEDIVTYTVEKGDNLSHIAHRFDTTTERLIELNTEQYPSLLDSPNYVEVGWIIIVSIKPPATPVPVSTPFSNTPGCKVSEIYWLESPITCEPHAVKLVTKVSFSLACVALDDNPLGYYKVVTIQEGWNLIDNRGVHSYTWLVDKEDNQVVIGPAIVTSEFSYPECGIPGNP